MANLTESAANSIINVKYLEFTFITENAFISEFTTFLEKVVLLYLKQMIPSTAIWGWKVKGKQSINVTNDYTVDKVNNIAISADWVAFGGNENNDDFIANYDSNRWHTN